MTLVKTLYIIYLTIHCMRTIYAALFLSLQFVGPCRENQLVVLTRK